MKTNSISYAAVGLALAVAIFEIGRFTAIQSVEKSEQLQASPQVSAEVQAAIAKGFQEKFGLKVVKPAVKQSDLSEVKTPQQGSTAGLTSESPGENEARPDLVAANEPTRYEDLPEAQRLRMEKGGFKFTGFARNSEGFVQANFEKSESDPASN